MPEPAGHRRQADMVARRQLLAGMTAGAGAAALLGSRAFAQRVDVAPPSTVTTPPRDFGPRGAPTTYFTDPDVLSVDPLFNQYRAAEQRPSHGCGRVRCGRKDQPGTPRAGISYGATFPTIVNSAGSKTMGRCRVFRLPSNNSNGNTFDFQGRQIACEHLTRRVVRYELNGSITVPGRNCLQRQAAQLAK